MKDVRSTQSRREIKPTGLPERRALWRYGPVVRITPLNRVWHHSLCDSRRWIYIPTQAQGES